MCFFVIVKNHEIKDSWIKSLVKFKHTKFNTGKEIQITEKLINIKRFKCNEAKIPVNVFFPEEDSFIAWKAAKRYQHLNWSVHCCERICWRVWMFCFFLPLKNINNVWSSTYDPGELKFCKADKRKGKQHLFSLKKG